MLETVPLTLSLINHLERSEFNDKPEGEG